MTRDTIGDVNTTGIFSHAADALVARAHASPTLSADHGARLYTGERDASQRQEAPTARVVVAFVGMDTVRALAAIARGLLDRRQRGDAPCELDAVVLGRRRERQPERDAMVVGDKTLLAVGFATVGRVGSDEATPFLAGTLRVSTRARLQSNSPAASVDRG